MPTLDPTILKLLPPLALAAASLYFFARGRQKPALGLLLLAAAALRLVMITLDPYLHPWDERFHALVAKNMMAHPFRPMLRRDAILPYDPAAWCCNHIWLHKQPLFLWQMALSMKLFGVNLVALRLPNAVMGVLAAYCTYRLAKLWSAQFTVGYVAAWLAALSYTQLELTSARLSLEHNDVAFGFYVTASLWAFTEYARRPGWRWALLAGLLAGAAVLVKWLTGLLVFGGWALYLLAQRDRRSDGRAWTHLAAAAVLGAIVFVPWQLYIVRAFPVESALEYGHNWQHFTDDLAHPGPWWFHLADFGALYTWALLPFVVIGAVEGWRRDRPLTAVFVAMIVVLYGFFSFVATKMPAFPFPVSALVFGFAAFGLCAAGSRLAPIVPKRARSALAASALAVAGNLVLKPLDIIEFRRPGNTERDRAIHNTAIYRQLDRAIPPDHVVFNCKQNQDTDIMFWQSHNAFYWFPNRREIRRLLDEGYKLAAIAANADHELPDYLLENDSIKKIQLPLK